MMSEAEAICYSTSSVEDFPTFSPLESLVQFPDSFNTFCLFSFLPERLDKIDRVTEREREREIEGRADDVMRCFSPATHVHISFIHSICTTLRHVPHITLFQHVCFDNLMF